MDFREAQRVDHLPRLRRHFAGLVAAGACLVSSPAWGHVAFQDLAPAARFLAGSVVELKWVDTISHPTVAYHLEFIPAQGAAAVSIAANLIAEPAATLARTNAEAATASASSPTCPRQEQAPSTWRPMRLMSTSRGRTRARSRACLAMVARSSFSPHRKTTHGALRSTRPTSTGRTSL